MLNGKIKKIVGITAVVGIIVSNVTLTQGAFAKTIIPDNYQKASSYSDPQISQTSVNNYDVDLSGNTVHIGSATTSFTPIVHLSRFGGESYLDVTLTGAATSFASSSLANGTITAENVNLAIIYSTVGGSTYQSLGGIDASYVLKRSIGTNQLTFSYTAKRIIPYMQLALTSEEIANHCTRPDYVVNSIALYGDSSQVNNTYQTGKLGHIYRMRD
jgi:hypothetical protein